MKITFEFFLNIYNNESIEHMTPLGGREIKHRELNMLEKYIIVQISYTFK